MTITRAVAMSSHAVSPESMVPGSAAAATPGTVAAAAPAIKALRSLRRI
jgi:hypothetical protein